MDRFDPGFNEIDPDTNRPFSGGHPDGAWIVAISLGIPVVAAALGVFVCIVMLFFGPLGKGLLTLAGAVLGAVVVCVIFVPPILLLFRRSRHAITWILCLLGVFAVIFGAGATAPAGNALGPRLETAGVIGCLLFGGIAWYLYGLRRQDLLG